MNQFIAQHVVEILDRKYEYTVNSPLDSFMLDLKGFVEFLMKDDLVSDFTGKIIHAFEVRHASLLEQQKKEGR